MREAGGIEAIREGINKLELRHDHHIKSYDPAGRPVCQFLELIYMGLMTYVIMV